LDQKALAKNDSKNPNRKSIITNFNYISLGDVMCFEKYLKQWKKKAGVVDYALLKLAAMVGGIWLATVFPQLTSYNHWYVLGLAVLLGLKPAMLAWSK
jgi:hypothetical protein